MKNLSQILVIILIAGLSLNLSSCKNSGKNPGHLKETVDKTGYEYTAAYVCPMHCKGSGSDEPGQCNICGMDYRKNKDHADHAGED